MSSVNRHKESGPPSTFSMNAAPAIGDSIEVKVGYLLGITGHILLVEH